MVKFLKAIFNGKRYLNNSFNSRLCKVKFGFTLAEVLVTLGIIGVVSAMTVPTLMQNYQRKSYVTQLHKFYNELSQALVQYQTDRNALNLREAGFTSSDALRSFFKSYFKVVNDCGEEIEPCLLRSHEYKKLSGAGGIGVELTYYLTIASGASMTFSSTLNGDCVASIYVDVNGSQGPNIAGRDLFAIYVYNDGTIDDAPGEGGVKPNKEMRDTAFTNNCTTDNPYWSGCFGKILNDNWEMSY